MITLSIYATDFGFLSYLLTVTYGTFSLFLFFPPVNFEVAYEIFYTYWIYIKNAVKAQTRLCICAVLSEP